jgi:hypothetical protein
MFWLRKITTDPHILAHVNIVCPDDRYAKLNTDTSGLILHGYDSIPLAYVKRVALFDLARFVNTGGFLIRHSKDHTRENTTPIKAVLRLFLTKHYCFNLKNN